MNLPISKINMTVVECCSCGLCFMIPGVLEMSLRETHRHFFCPNGHSLSFVGETDSEKLRKEKELAQQSARVAEEDAGKKAKALRILQKRVKAGVCPCCQRTVSQLARHMQSKHPEFAELKGTKEAP